MNFKKISKLTEDIFKIIDQNRYVKNYTLKYFDKKIILKQKVDHLIVKNGNTYKIFFDNNKYNPNLIKHEIRHFIYDQLYVTKYKEIILRRIIDDRENILYSLMYFNLGSERFANYNLVSLDEYIKDLNLTKKYEQFKNIS